MKAIRLLLVMFCVLAFTANANSQVTKNENSQVTKITWPWDFYNWWSPCVGETLSGTIDVIAIFNKNHYNEIMIGCLYGDDSGAEYEFIAKYDWLWGNPKFTNIANTAIMKREGKIVATCHYTYQWRYNPESEEWEPSTPSFIEDCK